MLLVLTSDCKPQSDEVCYGKIVKKKKITYVAVNITIVCPYIDNGSFCPRNFTKKLQTLQTFLTTEQNNVIYLIFALLKCKNLSKINFFVNLLINNFFHYDGQHIFIVIGFSGTNQWPAITRVIQTNLFPMITRSERVNMSRPLRINNLNFHFKNISNS